MNCVIGYTFAKQKRDEKSDPGRDNLLPGSKLNSRFGFDTVTKQKLHNVSMPLEILEAARYLFQKRGFDETTIADVCSRLDIKPSHFYNYFDSLDEVLEILWAR